jgi:hypothetical protein
VDGVRKAFEEFSKEHPDLNVQSVVDGESGGFEKWKGESITLPTGDFVDVDVKSAGGAVWDRPAIMRHNVEDVSSFYSFKKR